MVTKGGLNMPKNKSDSLEAYVSKITREVYRQLDNYEESFNNPSRNFHIINTYSDAVIAEDHVSEKIYQIPYNINDSGAVIFGELQEVEEAYVEKVLQEDGISLKERRGINRMVQITGPIVMKNAVKRIAYAAVLIPGEPDHDNEIVTKERIEDAAHEWLAGYRNVDLQHTLNNVATPVESFINPADMEVEAYGQKMLIPAGSWIIASKVQEDTWGRIESGELTGYSVMGIRRTTLDSAIKSKEDVALKRTLLQDLGPDWVPAAVSIVDEPCVPKAKFFALKSKEEPKVAEQKEVNTSFMSRLKSLFKIESETEKAEKAGRRFSQDTYNKLKRAYDSLTELMAEAEASNNDDDDDEANKNKGVEEVNAEEIKGIIETAIKEAVEPISQKVEELEGKIVEKVKEEEVKEEEEVVEKEKEEEKEDIVNEDLEAFKSAISERLGEIEKKVAPKSKSLPDEEEVVEKSKEERDVFGRKRRG